MSFFGLKTGAKKFNGRSFCSVPSNVGAMMIFMEVVFKPRFYTCTVLPVYVNYTVLSYTLLLGFVGSHLTSVSL